MDGSNLYHGGKRANVRIDVPKLAEALIGDREQVRTYYYVAAVPQEMDKEGAKAQQQFLNRLHSTPYLDVRLGRMEKRSSGWEEKGVDARLASDMVFMAARDLYDVAVLVSGDGDLAFAAQAVKDLGKHVENAYFKKGRSQHLIKSCDSFIELKSENFADCLKLEQRLAVAS